MGETATFRMVGPGGYVVIGFPSAQWVGPDETMTVPDDDVAVNARVDPMSGKEIPAQTTADCYRGQPTLWEEVTPSAAAPPSAPASPAASQPAAPSTAPEEAA